jgi:8-oxo-dGTP pyrophosphatase MutT (NUDIX family)
MKNCSLGFIFDTTLEHVLLVHKNSPAWQAGLINGPGGKIEPGETALDCMVLSAKKKLFY